MNMNNKFTDGWITISRKIINWEWYHNSNMVHLFIHLIIKANHNASNWQGNVINRGQIITGRKTLCSETGLSEQVIRTCLKNLKKTKEINIKATKKFSLITICNYDKYQFNNRETNQLPNQLVTNHQPSTNHPLTTNNNVKINNIEIKEKKYASQILSFYNEIIVFFPDEKRPKNVNEKKSWLETIEILNTEKKYPLPEIKKIIKHFSSDSFYKKHFFSLPKLLQTNSHGVLYIDDYVDKLGNAKTNIITNQKYDYNEMQKILENPKRLDFKL